ncbi:MAG: hypothetical protein BWY88_00564 [Synergistetes bacterium ADurb.Bin520]|nr:MAG: hypothetical protein BWY88_00564 [Synergistetes bacterium ADurb.Bin520]
MSPMQKVWGAPRRTAWLWRMQSSMVTGTVPSYPNTTIPRESPTRIMSIPAASAKEAVGKS